MFALDRGRLWLTTSRRAAKTRAWREDPRTAGLVRSGDRAVTFSGRCRLYDGLDPSTWPAALLHAPGLLAASLRFSLRNAQFFAGYARDARRVPFAWTPPGRVMVEVEVDAVAILDLTRKEVLERRGPWPDRVRSVATDRALPRGRLPDRRVPAEVRSSLGSRGEGVLGFWPGTAGSLAVLPASWARAPSQGAYLAAVPTAFLALAGAPPRGPVALGMDRASRWRAADMRGLLVQGAGSIHVPERTRQGRASLDRALRQAGGADGDALVRIKPERVVWWSGWSAGTVSA